MANVRETVRGITNDPNYAAQLTSIISDIGLETDDAKTYFETIKTDALDRTIDFVKGLVQICRYEGFNPRDMIDKLLAMHKAKKEYYRTHHDNIEEVSTILRINNEDREIKFSNNEDFLSDMEFICAIFITRGAAFEKIMKKSTETMKRCLNMLRAKYQINVVKKAAGVSLAADVITIPRIAASFPAITVGMFHKGLGRYIFDPSSLYNIEVLRIVFSPMITSVLPNSELTPLSVFYAIAVKTDVLHQVGNKTSLLALYQCMMASVNSTVLTSLKMKYCTTWGLGTTTVVNRLSSFTYKDEIIGLT